MPTRPVIIEPFRIKSVEPLPLLTPDQRTEALISAGYNLFRLPARSVTYDLLTDSGTGAMSAAQWAACIVGDESYAGSESFYRFERAVTDLTGFCHIVPTHQGRAAERILFSIVVEKGSVIPSNNHFDTTRANIEQQGGTALDLVIAEGRDPENLHPFKGNIDLERLERCLEEHRGHIPIGMITITNNTGGGQPVSLENLRAVSALYRRFEVPFFLDACRFAENAYFVKLREPGQQDRSVEEIAKEVFSFADGCLVSAKKDGLANTGGFLALNHDALAEQARNVLILTEGFPTYGGMAGRDLEAIAIGLREVLSEDYLSYRLATARYLAEGLEALGVPTVKPPGGHAVYVDAKAFLPHIPPQHFPGQALACEMYLRGGIRACEIGSVMFGRRGPDKDTFEPAAMELVRMAIPRRVYTQSHFDAILESLGELATEKGRLGGVRITHEPPFLRHFTATFAPIG